jgi:hypothetical protein
MPTISQILAQLGYTGTTGTTPYRPSSSAQVSALQNQYNNALNGQAIVRPPSTATQITLNFDGTQNNRDFVGEGESPTNVARLAGLTGEGVNPNSFYYSGIGAQTVPTGTLLPNGNLDPRSSPSNLQSIPTFGIAGNRGNEIINQAYDDLTIRVAAILAENPNAQIALNLTGFSRGGAEAVAFANLVNERGIPGLYPAGQVPINSMVLYDPVSQTNGLLNVSWPTNLANPALVLVATAENRSFFPAMPVGADSIIIPIEGVHSNVGGSFNPDGISAVTLKIARDYLSATGVPIAEIPSNLLPNWDHMYIHNSAIDSFGNIKFDTVSGDPTMTVGTNRYYEGTGLGSITVQDALARDFKVAPIYESRNGRLVLVGFNREISSNTTDTATGSRTQTSDVILYATDGQTVKGRNFTSSTADSTGQLTDQLVVVYAADGVTINSTSVTERSLNNTLVTTNRNGTGGTTSTIELQRSDDGSGSSTTTYPNGRVETLTTDSYAYVNGVKVLQSSNIVESFEDANGTSRIETLTTYTNGVPSTVRNVYNNDDTLFSSTPVAPSATNNLTNSQATEALNALNAFIGAVRGGRPVPLVTSGFNLVYTLGGHPANLQGANTVISGLGSVYGLHTAFQGGGTGVLLNTTDSIAAYVQGTWTAGVNGAENVNSMIQTIDNRNQSFERTEYAVGAQSEAALLLHAATGRVHESHGAMVKDTNQDLRDATYSIAADLLLTWTTGLNGSKNSAANDSCWRNAA